MWVTNVCGTQVHSPVSPDNLKNNHLIFVDGSIVDVDKEDPMGNPGFYFVDPESHRYVPLETPSTPQLPIVTVVEEDDNVIMTSHEGTKVVGSGGKYQVNLGKVDPRSGVQIGRNNIQINRF